MQPKRFNHMAHLKAVKQMKNNVSQPYLCN
jgi:hypothetical protein